MENAPRPKSGEKLNGSPTRPMWYRNLADTHHSHRYHCGLRRLDYVLLKCKQHLNVRINQYEMVRLKWSPMISRTRRGKTSTGRESMNSCRAVSIPLGSSPKSVSARTTSAHFLPHTCTRLVWELKSSGTFQRLRVSRLALDQHRHFSARASSAAVWWSTQRVGRICAAIFQPQ